MKLKGKPSGVSRFLIWAWIGLLAGAGLLTVPETSAGPSGRGSVKHSSAGRGSPGASPGRGSPGRGSPGRGTPGRSPGAGARRSNHAHHHHHGRYTARHDAWRDYRRFRAITGAIRLGAYYATRPRYSTTLVVTGTTYYYYGGVYYATSGSGYVVVSAPPRAVVYDVPTSTTIVYVGSAPYYYYGGTYYVVTNKPADQPPPPESDDPEDDSVGEEMTADDHNYEVVAPPMGATVPYLPDEADEETIAGTTYMVHEGTYYRPFVSEGETIYMVVETPG